MNGQEVIIRRSLTSHDPQEFARVIALYSYNATQEQKLRGIQASAVRTFDEEEEDDALCWQPSSLEAFRLHDLDGDGKLSRDDLLGYLALVLPPQRTEDAADAAEDKDEKEKEEAKGVSVCCIDGLQPAGKERTHDRLFIQSKDTRPLPEQVVERVLEEASSDATQQFLSFDDFVKVIQSTDFENRLVIAF
ncbi:hypothetical protein PINS_up004968 [Pythium insidiosum]|nr:hypothetical protein PINS_up004968 [Pythium insidiosum]